MKKMIYKSSIIVALILGFVGLKSINTVPSNPENKEALILATTIKYIQQLHFNPKPIDDNLSKFVYDTYLERIDGGKRYFTQEDIDQLKKHELNIDDQINAKTFEFFNLSYDILLKRMTQTKSYYEEIMSAPFDINNNKEIELDEEKKPWAKNDVELKQYWQDFLQYEMMTRLYRKIKDQDSKKDTLKVLKTQEELLADVRKDVKKTFGDWFNRLDKLKRSDRFEIYVGSITNYFDPHTDFFNAKEKQDFDINMGGKLEGIGARLQAADDYIKVSNIIPGGPAWKGKDLQEGDIILSAAQEGKEPVDLVGMRVDDAVLHIRGKKGTKVTLAVKKQDGTIKNITIERDEVIIDESFAKSVLLDIPGTINNVGYIKLPKFYSSFEKEDGNSCAADVAKEIEKLKENNVNGIILDLRNNTGGSLNDVVDMSGLFIEQGPIVQVKSRDANPYLHNDRDSRVQYNGPFIILVNENSASASEIIAAAMQDYDRAVIVGSPSTFGKGSVQRFFNLDKAVVGNEDLKPLGEVKISVQKFYRVDGGSTQLKGVIPDIILPDNYMYLETGEKEYKNAMPWTEIAPQQYSQNVAKIENLSSLVEKSKMRVKNNESFIKVEENAERLKKNKDNTKSNLSLAEYSKEVDQIEQESKKYDDLFKNDIQGFVVRNMPQDIKVFDSDDSKKARNEDFIKGLKKDFYLTEAMNIMKDMIVNEKSFTSIRDKIGFNKN
jgi:carboxyl-terminal processing protease